MQATRGPDLAGILVSCAISFLREQIKPIGDFVRYASSLVIIAGDLIKKGSIIMSLSFMSFHLLFFSYRLT